MSLQSQENQFVEEQILAATKRGVMQAVYTLMASTGVNEMNLTKQEIIAGALEAKNKLVVTHEEDGSLTFRRR